MCPFFEGTPFLAVLKGIRRKNTQHKVCFGGLTHAPYRGALRVGGVMAVGHSEAGSIGSRDSKAGDGALIWGPRV